MKNTKNERNEFEVEVEGEVIKESLLNSEEQEDEVLEEEVLEEEQDEEELEDEDEVLEELDLEEDDDDDDEEVVEEIEDDDILSQFKTCTSKNRPPLADNRSGAVSIINTKKNGKRLIVSKEIMQKFKKPNYLEVRYTDSKIAILPSDKEGIGKYVCKNVKEKGIIYCKGLVEEITEVFDLDFSDRTSITFNNFKFVKSNGLDIAIIRIE